MCIKNINFFLFLSGLQCKLDSKMKVISLKANVRQTNNAKASDVAEKEFR